VIDSLIKYPLWNDDGKAVAHMNDLQVKARNTFKSKVSSGDYSFVKSNCVCGNNDLRSDELVGSKDRFGISCANILCGKCGVIRLEYRFDEDSNAHFYEHDYRDLYVGKELASESFFSGQVVRGESLLALVKENIDLSRVHTVFEVGCGAGGVLYPFYNDGKNVSGCDFGDKYIQYGLSKGLILYKGDIDFEQTKINSQDLVVLSHVMEHFTQPVETLKKIISVISPSKFLLVEVPGILSVRSSYCDNPLYYFQNAHIYNYHEAFLKLFFEALGLKVIYSNELCVFLLQKPDDWKPKEYCIDTTNLAGMSRSVSKELKKSYLQYKLKINPFVYRRLVRDFLEKVGILSLIKKGN